MGGINSQKTKNNSPPFPDWMTTVDQSEKGGEIGLRRESE